MRSAAPAINAVEVAKRFKIIDIDKAGLGKPFAHSVDIQTEITGGKSLTLCFLAVNWRAGQPSHHHHPPR